MTDGEDCIKLEDGEVGFHADLATVTAGSENYKLDSVSCQNEVVPISQLDLSSYGEPVPYSVTIVPDSAPAGQVVVVHLNDIETERDFEMPNDFEEGVDFALDFFA